MTKMKNFTKGFIKENPIFVFLLGMCPALAVTATFETAFGMGLLVIFVLTLSNFVISLVRNFIPDNVRTPSYIVIIATLVTLVDLLSKKYLPSLAESLGVFIPLIVVNCLILGRAEAYASKNKVVDSLIDGVGMGLGFTFGLVVIGLVREFLGTGSIVWGQYLPFFVDEPIRLFSLDWVLGLIDLYVVDIFEGTYSFARYTYNAFSESYVASSEGTLRFMYLGDDSLVATTTATLKDDMLGMFVSNPGAFIGLGFILAFMQGKKVRKEKEAKRIMDEKIAAAKAKKAAKLKEQAAKEVS